MPWQILVKQSKMADVTSGGLFMPADSTEKPSEGVVVLAGPGTTHPETGKLIPNPCKPGDLVLLSDYVGEKVDYCGDKHAFVAATEVHPPPPSRTTTLTPHHPLAPPPSRPTTFTPHHSHAPLSSCFTTPTPHYPQVSPPPRPTILTPHHPHAPATLLPHRTHSPQPCHRTTLPPHHPVTAPPYHPITLLPHHPAAPPPCRRTPRPCASPPTAPLPQVLGIFEGGAPVVGSFKPLRDRVLVKLQDAATETTSGIALASESTEEPTQGEVIAVGAGLFTSQGDVVPPGISVGESVIYGAYTGTTVNIEGGEYKVVSAADCLAKW